MTERSTTARHAMPAGKIEVMPQAIASIAAHAALSSPGVVSLARPVLSDDQPARLGKQTHQRGVEVQLQNGEVTVDVYLVLAYGARIAEVAQQVQTNVQQALEHALGTATVHVGVRVQGLELPKNER